MTGLIADIGGTNARFALVDDTGEIHAEQVLACADFSDPLSAARHYLGQNLTGDTPRPRRAALCVACPVLGDHVQLTNGPWGFSRQALMDALAPDGLDVVNDFVAQALAVPHLRASDRLHIAGPDTAPVTAAGTPIAVVGPGTGLGVGLLIPDGRGSWLAPATEGGHVTLAARTDREAAILATLRQTGGGLGADSGAASEAEADGAPAPHISAESCVSGSGLPGLYAAVCHFLERPAEPRTPAEIMDDGVAGRCPACTETVDLFFAFLGTVAGNLVLSTGARGGVALMGGILPRYVDALNRSAFYERFLEKGRFRRYLEPVPIHLGTHAFPALLGLAALVSAPVRA